jgi:Ca2+-binding RTX toxin-like protein
MPDFVISTTEQMARSLEQDDLGLVTATGTLFTAGFGISISGRAQLTVEGAVHAAGNGIDISNGGAESTIVNDGTISSRIDAIRFLGEQDSYIDIVNTGDILAVGLDGVAIRTEGEVYISNAGVIASSGSPTLRVDGDFGLINLFNSGTIVSGDVAVLGGEQKDVVENTGVINGGISLRGGTDRVEYMSGVITGTIDGGPGNDVYVIGNVEATLNEAQDAGTDQVSSSQDWALDDNFENLALLGQARLGRGNELTNFIAGNAADNVLQGRAGSDDLAGQAGFDQLFGGIGNDGLSGAAGEDSLFGGFGADTLSGGTGADTLTGGQGTDRFLFLAVADSRPDDFDTITDFARGGERIDLSQIDTRPGTAQDDAFAFRGAQAFSAAAQVRIVDLGADVRVEINLTGTSGAEAAFLVRGVGTLTTSDFLL